MVIVFCFNNKENVIDYSDENIDHTTVGFGVSLT